jgi:ethanolamine ammonia-lyase large subunit
VCSQDPVRIAKEREITTRFQNTVGLRGRVRVRPHSNHRADPRTAHQAGLSLQRGSVGSNVAYFETGRRSALSCYRISPRGLSLEATFVLRIGAQVPHLQEII